VGRALTLVRHQAELKDIELVQELAPNLPLCLCDADQVQQVILVLLVNALEAIPHGGRVEVITQLDASGAAAQIRVRDSGPGIAADVLPRIFEPFFTTKEDQHRTGLGLAVACTIAEHHGGTLTVESAPEKGAEFTLTLPLGARVTVGTPANGENA
jgi:signal transduction histidine kinase